MPTIGIIGAGEVGSQIARAALAHGYSIVIANSRGPETLQHLVAELGPSARAARAADAAAAGDFAVVAVPLKTVNNLPVDALAGKIVLDTNNYMIWRDGHFARIDSGETTVLELRQEHLPASRVVQAFTHIQAPRITTSSPTWAEHSALLRRDADRRAPSAAAAVRRGRGGIPALTLRARPRSGAIPQKGPSHVRQ
ncbi:NADPH-dependent F420 reductase [Streptomyces mirabilis]